MGTSPDGEDGGFPVTSLRVVDPISNLSIRESIWPSSREGTMRDKIIATTIRIVPRVSFQNFFTKLSHPFLAYIFFSCLFLIYHYF